MEVTSNIIHCMDCLEGMKQLNEYSINILYTDPPYNLDSRYIIDSVSGHYRFKGKGKDFMSKWDAMDGYWWQDYFTQAFRIMKHGSFVIMHNIDRQSDMWTYYARKAGFMPMQKLYWLFISNFPKATDVALMIDKKTGTERNVVGTTTNSAQMESTGKYGTWGQTAKKEVLTDIRGGNYLTTHNPKKEKLIRDVTEATHPLAKKYDGYKYGQAALKQILEEVLVFWKSPRSSVISDILSIEKNTLASGRIHPAVLNIGLTRKMIKENRHTPQMLVDSRIAPYMRSNRSHQLDTVGINESLMHIKFTEEDFEDYYFYEPKVSKEEKEEGLDGFTSLSNPKAGRGTLLTDEGKDKWDTYSKNPHPTPKPLALCRWVLDLFTPPVPITVLDTFAGQGSIPRVCQERGIEWYGFELKPKYCEVANRKVQTAHLTLFG